MSLKVEQAQLRSESDVRILKLRRIQKETLFSKNYLSDIVSDCDVLRAETDKLSPNVQDLSKEVDRVSIERDQVLFEREAVNT